jgi:hypothetical protein
MGAPRTRRSEPTPAGASSSPSVSPSLSTSGGPPTRPTQVQLPRARGSEPTPAEASSSPPGLVFRVCDQEASSDTQVSHMDRSATNGVTVQKGKGMLQNSTGLRVVARRAGSIRNRISNWQWLSGWSDNPKWKQTRPQTPTRFAPNVADKPFEFRPRHHPQYCPEAGPEHFPNCSKMSHHTQTGAKWSVGEARGSKCSCLLWVFPAARRCPHVPPGGIKGGLAQRFGFCDTRCGDDERAGMHVKRPKASKNSEFLDSLQMSNFKRPKRSTMPMHLR